MDERESKLPVWAKELVSNLRQQVEALRKQLDAEKWQEKLKKLEDKLMLESRRNGGLMELIECAAKGGHITCQDMVEVFAGYSLTLTKDDDQHI